MQVEQLELRHFRSHKKNCFELDPKLTLITGPNGSGKTSILEAIYLLATGKSPKAIYDIDLVSHNHTFGSAKATITSADDIYNVEIQILRSDNDSNISSKRVKVNKAPKAVSYLSNIFNAVMFSPEDIQLLTGSPANRRKYIDLLLSQTFRPYRKNLSSYVKAVRQRNKVLEMINEMGRGRDQIDFWDQQILGFGAQVAKDRHEFVTFVKANLDKISYQIHHDKHEWSIEYKSNEISEERIKKYKDREIAAKSTLVGPHRDDFHITLNGKNAAEFASRGQQRTIVLALKLLEISFIELYRPERPILLLDDIFSELDEKHREAVLVVIDKQQTIITSAEPTEFLPKNIGMEISL